jgi:uncharacterized DUF497 family protein
VRCVWAEAKRQENLEKHGLDFVEAPEVFAGPTCTVEDDRFAYGEQRFLTFGFLRGLAVSIVHTETEKETENEIRIISFRKATRRETAFLIGHL